ncbi:MAG: hypothetical protein M1317_07105 [Candidatus Thermoplasmatota archaeon]|nr:hypothetical protein [Candidatus Thermoplasmatota archaeon]
MINYEELETLLENTDFSYFSIVSDSHEVYSNLKGDLKRISSCFAVQKLVNKVSLEEYTGKKYQKVEQDDDILIEREIENSRYKFVKMGSFKTLEQIISTAISVPAMYIFIDSGNTFEQLSYNLSMKDMPNVLVKYRHGKFKVDDKIFSSIESLGDYIMKRYYL